MRHVVLPLRCATHSAQLSVRSRYTAVWAPCVLGLRAGPAWSVAKQRSVYVERYATELTASRYHGDAPVLETQRQAIVLLPLHRTRFSALVAKPSYFTLKSMRHDLR
jgi:hypothetical protein